MVNLQNAPFSRKKHSKRAIAGPYGPLTDKPPIRVNVLVTAPVGLDGGIQV